MNETVTSLQNPLVKQAVALQQKKRRDEAGLFIVEGTRQAEELLASGWPIEFGLFTGAAARQERIYHLIQTARLRCQMTQVTDQVFAKAAETEQPQGILLAARQTVMPLTATLSKEDALLVVLDGVQDPGNLGALLRVADAAGAGGVIVLEGSADPFGGKAVRASMGSLFHLPLTVGVNHEALLAELKAQQIRLVATALEGADSYLNVNLTGRLAVVFGNEGKGVSREILEAVKEKLHIPIYGQAESLNVATAAAVILYEAARQRQGCVSL